ncbi:Concanavalin A-like lectin/glucanases superfamily protein [Variovorax sp. EL159]|nr:Concanavalin A-like lectin/glucanases superfamily protein [Variovorax sp. EL159]
MPSLQGLGTVLPAYTGGIKGQTTQQQATDGPAWATLLTGAWADRHEIRSNYEGQSFKADTVFKLLKQSRATARTAAIASWSGLPQLLRADKAAGYLDMAKDCGGSDSCVSSEASAAIESGGYDLIVADYQGPAQVADVAGYGTDYQNALAQVDAQITKLKASLAKRRAAQPNEDWMVIVTTTHGLGATGVADGIPVPSNLATVIALDKPANLAAAAPSALPVAIEPWYAYAAATDIAPTVLTHLSARPTADKYVIDGSPLTGAAGVRQLSAVTNKKSNGIQLAWTLPGTPAAITVMRDGTTVATLPGNALGFEDTTMAPAASGFFTYNYTVVADQVPVSLRATLKYVKPVVLMPSLSTGLTHLFALKKTLADRIDGTQLFTPWVSGATPVYAAAGDGPFGGTDTALLSTNYAGPTVCTACDGGYRIPTASVTSTTAPFTFGFWFRSDATRSGMPVVSNKNWKSGDNAGLAIGQYGNAMRFNIGRGGARLGDKDLSFSANTWAYVAMTFDVPGLKVTYYVYDPVYGMQNSSATLTAAFVTALNGLGGSFTLNEDGDGGYGPNYRNGSAANTIGGRFDFGEFSTWNRALTAAEVESIARSGTSLTTLVP